MSPSPSVLGPAGGGWVVSMVCFIRLEDPAEKQRKGPALVRGRRRRRQSRRDRRRRAVYALRASCPVPTCRPRAGSRLTPGLLAPYFSPGAACCLQGRSKAGLGPTRLEYGTVSRRPALVRATQPAAQLHARAARRAELWAVSRPARAKWAPPSMCECAELSVSLGPWM